MGKTTPDTSSHIIPAGGLGQKSAPRSAIRAIPTELSWWYNAKMDRFGEGLHVVSNQMKWTNKSVLKFAGSADLIDFIEAKARELVLLARDAGWSGPPYNPLAIADLLKRVRSRRMVKYLMRAQCQQKQA